MRGHYWLSYEELLRGTRDCAELDDEAENLKLLKRDSPIDLVTPRKLALSRHRYSKVYTSGPGLAGSAVIHHTSPSTAPGRRRSAQS